MVRPPMVLIPHIRNAMDEGYLPDPTVKSIGLAFFNFANGYPHVLDFGRIKHLEHLTDVVFSRFEQFADLKYSCTVVVTF